MTERSSTNTPSESPDIPATRLRLTKGGDVSDEPAWLIAGQAALYAAVMTVAEKDEEIERLRSALHRITQVAGNRGDWAIRIAEEALTE